MRISTDMIYQNATNAIVSQEAQVSQTQSQLSSGKNVMTPSDNPTAAVQIQQLQSTIDQTNTYQTNINYAQSSLTAEGSALSSSSDLLQQIRDLAVEANNGVVSNSDLQSIAQQVEQDLGGLMNLANSKDGNGNFLFSGNSTSIQPFSQSGAGLNYAGDQGQRAIQISSNSQIAVADSGYSVFQNIKNGNGTFVTSYNDANTGTGIISAGQVTDPSAWVPDTYTLTFSTPTTYQVTNSASAVVASGTYQSGGAINFNGAQVSVTGTPASGDSFTIAPSTNQDVFTTVQNFINSLNANPTSASARANFSSDLNQTLSAIDQATANITNVTASVGARQNAITNQSTQNQNTILGTQTALSALQDLDYASAATQLSQQTLALQAAQQSFVKLQGLSLFNYITA